MIVLYILIVALIVYGGCVTGAFIASKRQQEACLQQVWRAARERDGAAYESGIEAGRSESIWSLVNVLESSTPGPFNRDKCYDDLSAALKKWEVRHDAECSSGTGTASR